MRYYGGKEAAPRYSTKEPLFYSPIPICPRHRIFHRSTLAHRLDPYANRLRPSRAPEFHRPPLRSKDEPPGPKVGPWGRCAFRRRSHRTSGSDLQSGHQHVALDGLRFFEVAASGWLSPVLGHLANRHLTLCQRAGSQAVSRDRSCACNRRCLPPLILLGIGPMQGRCKGGNCGKKCRATCSTGGKWYER